MKKLIFMITVVFCMAACTSTNNPDLFQDDEKLYSHTRAMEDSDDLANSLLLNDLVAYNTNFKNCTDVETASSPTISLSRVEYVYVSDMLGYVIGYESAQRAGLRKEIVEIIATIQSAITSISAAIETIAHHLPPISGVTFESYENMYSAVTNASNYHSLVARQYQLLGNMSMFTEFRSYFDSSINHNLIIHKYRSGLADSDIVTDLFNDTEDTIIYSDEFQCELSEELKLILTRDIDYIKLFSDHKNQTTSLSQKIAGETLKLYVEAISDSHPQLDQLKSLTYYYMNSIANSSELNLRERTILLRAIPIAITSSVMWTSVVNQNIVY